MKIKTNHSKTVLILFLLVSFLTFFIHYTFIEKPIQEYRFSYTVTPKEYPTILSELQSIYFTLDGEDYFISPIIEIIPEQDKIDHIRHFFLRITTTSRHIEAELVSKTYYQNIIINAKPKLIYSQFQGSSIPLQKSLGYLFLVLIVSYTFLIFLKEKSSTKQ